MLRSGASRALLRTFTTSPASSIRVTVNGTCRQLQWASRASTLARKRPQPLAMITFKPVSAAIVRHASQVIPGKPDSKAEEDAAGNKLHADPAMVSTASSVHPVFGEVGAPDPEPDTDMMAGIRSDLKTIADTFSMKDVPREAFVIGMAGVLPYLATSAATIYCAWEVHRASMNAGYGFLMSDHTAELALHVLEPLQIGYGAVIISFLGAIHWGLEWAGFGGHIGYRRYAIGVVAAAVAWPTILLPVEYALVAQFLTFNFLYYADTRATRLGWAPQWYGVYRFVLTFIVGASIVASLIGRGQIADRIGTLPGTADKIKQLRNARSADIPDEEQFLTRNMASSGKKDKDDAEEEDEE